jgi:hypothetical protein
LNRLRGGSASLIDDPAAAFCSLCVLGVEGFRFRSALALDQLDCGAAGATPPSPPPLRAITR